jgi:hypothetical protein
MVSGFLATWSQTTKNFISGKNVVLVHYFDSS